MATNLHDCKAGDDTRQFIQRSVGQGCRIALVTSGGTIVALERNTVRFLDNFSTGKRGALLAEHLIDSGRYSVIFLHRSGSIIPWMHSLSFLSLGSVLDQLSISSPSSALLRIDETQFTNLTRVLSQYARGRDRICYVEFTTVQEYLDEFERICRLLNPVESASCIIAAAAVSDFVMDENNISEHKIESSNAFLSLHLRPCKKILGLVKESLAPKSFLISFKLETDESKLVHKALLAIEKYHPDIVVGNLLHERHSKVLVITPDHRESIASETLEADLASFIMSRHDSFMQQSSALYS